MTRLTSRILTSQAGGVAHMGWGGCVYRYPVIAERLVEVKKRFGCAFQAFLGVLSAQP